MSLTPSEDPPETRIEFSKKRRTREWKIFILPTAKFEKLYERDESNGWSFEAQVLQNQTEK